MNSLPPHTTRHGAKPRTGGPRSAREKKSESRLRLILRVARIVVPALLAVAGLALLYHRIDLQTVQAVAARVNGVTAFILLTVLPLVGFPVSVLHIAAGVRFGFRLGIELSAVAILLQLLASYALVHLWRDAFARRLAKVRKRIPQGAHGSVCLFTLLLPGVPFFAQNYTLALLGVPLRTYLLWCLPLHILRSLVTVGLGGQTHHLTKEGLAALAAYGLTLLFVSWWTYRRLRQQLANQPAAADDPTPLA